jgi:NDP-sugar pyrophosphorylase family protein
MLHNLLEIAPGVRFLDVVLDQAARHGFTDIVLLAVIREIKSGPCIMAADCET